MQHHASLLRGFMQQSVEQMEHLAQAVESRDFKLAARLAHSLANTFVAIRDTDGMRQAYALETAAARKAATAMDACLISVKAELDRATDTVRQRLAQLPADNPDA